MADIAVTNIANIAVTDIANIAVTDVAVQIIQKPSESDALLNGSSFENY